MPTQPCRPRDVVRVPVYELKRHNRVFFANQSEVTRLTRLGLARTFGTRRRIVGVRLLVETRVAAERLWENNHLDRAPGGGLRTVTRELVGGGHHVWSHRNCSPRSQATNRVLSAAA
jgi:hypothetical protein